MTTPRKHILMTSCYFPPLGSAGASIRQVKTIKYLKEQDMRFTVIASDPDRHFYPEPTNSSQYLLEDLPEWTRVVRTPSLVRIGARSSTGSSPQKQTRHGTSIRMRRTLRAILNGLRSYLIPDTEVLWSLRARKPAMKAVAHDPVDLIFSSGPPVSSWMLGVDLSRRLGRPLVVEMKDDWVGAPYFDFRPALVRFFARRMEAKMVHAAQSVITVTEDSQRHYQSRYPALANKFVMIPNGYDPEEFSDLHRSRRESGIFRIISAGGYARKQREPLWFFRALGRLVRSRPDLAQRIRLILYGDWLYRDFSEDELSELGIASIVEERSPPPRSELLQSLVDGDLLLCNTYLHWPRAIPGKLYEYWATGSAPVLLLDDGAGAARDLLRTYHLGTAIERTQEDEIIAYLSQMLQEWEDGSRQPISTDGIARFSRKQLALETGQVIERSLAARQT